MPARGRFTQKSSDRTRLARRRMGVWAAALFVGTTVAATIGGCKRRAPAPASPPGPSVPAPPKDVPAAVIPPSTPPETEALAFARRTDDGFEVCVANADGGALTVMEARASSDPYLMWSPDGARLSYITRQGDGRSLIVAAADGKSSVKLGDGAIAATPCEQWGQGGKAISAVCATPSGPKLYVFAADGSSSRQIAIGVEDEDALDFWDYSWRPGRPSLAFEQNRPVGDEEGDGEPEWCRVAIADLESGSIREVAPDLRGVCLEPCWSPDGKHLVFYNKQPDHPTALYVTDDKGRRPKLVSEGCEPPGRDHWWPAWSPDSKKLVFECQGCEQYAGDHCHVVDLKGRLVAHIAPERGCFDPRWSPDGRRILVFLGEGVPGVGVYDLDSDGFGTVGQSLVGGVLIARWAPDGRRILLVGDADKPGVLAIASVTNDASRTVSGEATNVAHAAWSPSGERLLFVTASADDPDLGTLYTVNADGTQMTKVCEGLIATTSAAWQPTGE